ncbi:hypothetical protein SDC9_92593 [bioreactor metagenome]|uniref:Uncharacterized protein n=1 Tax=bioreactor metagenome TaxID=1076179 RepID=A0A645A100_9ZZZZ
MGVGHALGTAKTLARDHIHVFGLIIVIAGDLLGIQVNVKLAQFEIWCQKSKRAEDLNVFLGIFFAIVLKELIQDLILQLFRGHQSPFKRLGQFKSAVRQNLLLDLVHLAGNVSGDIGIAGRGGHRSGGNFLCPTTL